MSTPTPTVFTVHKSTPEGVDFQVFTSLEAALDETYRRRRAAEPGEFYRLTATVGERTIELLGAGEGAIPGDLIIALVELQREAGGES